MTDNARTPEQLEAIQNVVNHVAGYQDGAPEGTVDSELRRGFSEAGVELSDDDVAKLASAIEDEHANVDAASVLGGSDS